MAILEAEKREKMALLQIINKNNTNKEEYSKGKIKSGNQQVFEAPHLDENYVSSNEPNKILINK